MDLYFDFYGISDDFVEKALAEDEYLKRVEIHLHQDVTARDEYLSNLEYLKSIKKTDTMPSFYDIHIEQTQE
jgi:hypothetical protein